jgi:translation elongation factor P/translation initiation factor 5A
MLTPCEFLNTNFGKLGKNDLFLYSGNILKILDKTHSKPGKHGAAKVKLTSVNYFREFKKQVITMPASENVQKINIPPKIAYITRIFTDSGKYTGN